VLAYVFWHWKRDGASAEEYEDRQRAFHRALAAEPPGGFRRSLTSALSGAPWAAAGGAAYEDWYLLDEMASLQPLNDAAVTAGRRQPHDDAAGLAAGGAAGLYALRTHTAMEAPTHAAWFSKPAGARYADLFDELLPLLDAAGATLWMRQMVLGPTPEFCAHSTAAIALPSRFAQLRLQLRPVWP
jgi:hypothetical protein